MLGIEEQRRRNEEREERERNCAHLRDIRETQEKRLRRQDEQARLWAAAPELLAACKAALETCTEPDNRIEIQLRAAIAKAEQ